MDFDLVRGGLVGGNGFDVKDRVTSSGDAGGAPGDTPGLPERD